MSCKALIVEDGVDCLLIGITDANAEKILAFNPMIVRPYPDLTVLEGVVIVLSRRVDDMIGMPAGLMDGSVHKLVGIALRDEQLQPGCREEWYIENGNVIPGIDMPVKLIRDRDEQAMYHAMQSRIEPLRTRVIFSGFSPDEQRRFLGDN